MCWLCDQPLFFKGSHAIAGPVLCVLGWSRALGAFLPDYRNLFIFIFWVAIGGTQRKDHNPDSEKQ